MPKKILKPRAVPRSLSDPDNERNSHSEVPPALQRVRFIVSYDGTEFCGWQRQNQGGKKSVAQVIEEALHKVFKQRITLFASGRTDSGVHALNQVCHFDCDWSEEKLLQWDFAWAMKPHLPSSIVVKDAWLTTRDFHATISATHKTYRYYIWNQPRPSPILQRYSHWIRNEINIDHLNECSSYILGEHDFRSFQSVGTEVPHTIREIYKAQWKWKRKGYLEFTITGSGFLKQMVRNIVGTQLLLERKSQPPSEMKRILEAKDRQKAGPPAPAEGLFLSKVYYPAPLDLARKPMKSLPPQKAKSVPSSREAGTS